jgi:hypothetical protein
MKMNLIALTLLFGCSPFRQVGDQDKPVLKVFLLAGQSNMEGQGVVDLDHAEHYNGGRGILTRVLEDPNIAREFGHLRGDDGNWTKRDDVFVWYQPARGPLKAGPLSIGYAGYEGLHHFGPELALGWELGEHFDEPVLLIKTAWGGKSLMNDFRPPSSGGEVGPYYHQMLTEYAAAIAGFGERFPGLAGCEAQLSGFIWFQGWNDMFTEGGLKAYSENLVNLVGDLRVHFSQPNLPFIVGQTGNADNEELWAAQEEATIWPAFLGRAGYVPTRSFLRKPEDSPNSGHGHHWFGNAESYLLIGQALGRGMVELTDPNESARKD